MGALPQEKACQASEVEAPLRGRLIVLDGGVRQQRRRGGTNGLVPVDLTDVARERTKQRKRRARVRWTDKLRQVLVAAYLKGGVGEAKRAIRLVRPDMSDQCIVQELNRLGLRTPEPRPRRPLGEKEQAFVLNSIGGSTFRLLAEELERPVSTIWSFARRRGYSADHQTESFKCKDVAGLLGVTGRQVRRWICKWYLWTEHRRVPVESLALFVKECSGLLPPERLPVLKKWLGELVDGIRLEDVRESQKEVAARLGVTKGTVRDWLRIGWLQRSGKGVTWGAVARFLQEHPEEIQYGALRPHFKEWVKRLGYRTPTKAGEPIRQSEQSPINAYSAAAGSA
jgi:hypothetical protein